jgi:hypothetical protein
MKVRLPNPFRVTTRRSASFSPGWRDHLVALSKAHPANALGGAAHGSRTAFVEADRLSLTRDHEDVVVARRVQDRDELVLVAELDRDDPVRLEIRVVLREAVFLTTPFFVARTRYSASPKSRVAISVRTLSPCARGRRLTSARPFDCRLPSGSSCTFSR